MIETPNPVRPSKVEPLPSDQDGQNIDRQNLGGQNPRDHHPHAPAEEGIPSDLKEPSGFAIAIAVGVFVLLLVALLIIGEIPNYREKRQTRDDADRHAKQLPVVQYVQVSPQSGTHDVTLPCNVKANQATALYTRTSGYLREWHFDIGQHVNAGDVMADIDTPEVDAQLAQSKATVVQDQANIKRAAADLDLAKTTYKRYVDAQKQSPGSVTQEDVDTKRSALDDADAALQQANATVAAAQADVDRLTKLVGFEKVIAPFSGTVTARNYDRGALLSPNNTGLGSEIFDLAETDLLRVFVNVPQEYANDIKLKDKAKLYVRNFPTKPFEGVIDRTAGAVDPNSRTLAVQIDFINKDGQLFAGEYGEIHLPVTDAETVGLIPTSALLFNAQARGLQVATVDDGNKVHMKSIKTGRDFGTTIEVTDGVTATDKIITNPSERVSEGADVEPHLTSNGSPASQPTRAAK